MRLPCAQGRVAWTGATGWCMVGAPGVPWRESFVKKRIGNMESYHVGFCLVEFPFLVIQSLYVLNISLNSMR